MESLVKMVSFATALKVVRWEYARPELHRVALGWTLNAGWELATKVSIHVKLPTAHKEHPVMTELHAPKMTNAPRANARETHWIVRHLGDPAAWECAMS